MKLLELVEDQHRHHHQGDQVSHGVQHNVSHPYLIT